MHGGGIRSAGGKAVEPHHPWTVPPRSEEIAFQIGRLPGADGQPLATVTATCSPIH